MTCPECHLPIHPDNPHVPCLQRALKRREQLGMDVKLEDGLSLPETVIDQRLQECDLVITLHVRESCDIAAGIQGVLATGFVIAYAHCYPDGVALLVKGPPLKQEPSDQVKSKW